MLAAVMQLREQTMEARNGRGRGSVVVVVSVRARAPRRRACGGMDFAFA